MVRPLGGDCCKQDVFGCADAREGQGDFGAAEPAVNPAAETAVLLHDRRAEPPQPFDVQVDRARAQFTAAGEGEAGPAAAGENRAKEEDRGTHLPHELFGQVEIGDVPRIDGDPVVLPFQNAAEHGEDLSGRIDIRKGGAVIEGRPAAEQGGREDGQNGVFCTVDGDFALQTPPAVNQ